MIIDCDEGEIHYKFYAEGAWKHDHKQACVRYASFLLRALRTKYYYRGERHVSDWVWLT